MQEVLPIPEGPSTIMHRPGVLSATSTLSYSAGATKVNVGTPDFLNTSSMRGKLFSPEGA